MNYTRFLEDILLPAWDLPAGIMETLKAHGTLAGSAAVQCVLGTTDWWAGGLDIFVEGSAAADAIGEALLGYDMVWRGEAEGPTFDLVNDNFAAAVEEMRIYQRWMDWNGFGARPTFADIGPTRVRLEIRIYVGCVQDMVMRSDLLHGTTHYKGGEWYIAPGAKERWTRDRFCCDEGRKAKWIDRGFQIA